MNHVYKVPIIPQNLNKHETIIQVAEVLNHLSNVTDDIFKHISNKVESSRKKLDDVSARIDVVNKKITKLSGAKKAIQVFSSCKYPASELNEPYCSIFSDVNPPELVRHKVKHKKLVKSDEPIDKLHVYHVKVKSGNESETITGLGDIPKDIECLNDLLLYNTGKNLYKNFVISDALSVSQQVREQDSNENSSIGVAPHSISERSTLTRSSTQNYFYNPNLGELPALDVPLDLPDLPNIADDLRYDTELGPGIAPSVITSPNIPDLPVIEVAAREPEKISLDEVELPAPPPPPPPPPVMEIPEPPQLPLVPEVQAVPPVTESKQEAPKIDEIPKVANIPEMDMHASLMEAIRKAGGAKNLKSRSDSDKEPPKTKAAAGGDLMADLHAKLAMRRKGISGAKKPELMDASTALEKISAMIPPPVRSTDELNENTEDEDWDD